MRLHSLSLTAFGPFPDTVEVDLDDAGRDGLFLLWGPTGAGKTTLLDAVVFAFYGTVPGARGEEKRLRSDHAGPVTRTEVTVEQWNACVDAGACPKVTDAPRAPNTPTSS